jgi:hypothetical protein
MMFWRPFTTLARLNDVDRKRTAMKRFFAWWYHLSLPRRAPDITPEDRERTRYARLTSIFSLLILCITLPLGVNTIIKDVKQTGPLIAIIGLVCLFCSLVANKLGYNRIAAFLLILDVTLLAGGALIRNELDPAFVPVFCALVVTVILAGSLMPPIFALVVALMNCVIITLVTQFQLHTPYYDQMVNTGGRSLVFVLPIALQIIVGVVIYVIMTNLITTIRRADRAEEIVALQKEIVDHQRRRVQDQQQLEEGIAMLAQIYNAVANGDVNARAPANSESVLWQVAVPLNNLLNRVQRWKTNSDVLERTLLAVKATSQEMQRCRQQHLPVIFHQPTDTPIDLMLPEVYQLSQYAFGSRTRPSDGM